MLPVNRSRKREGAIKPFLEIFLKKGTLEQPSFVRYHEDRPAGEFRLTKKRCVQYNTCSKSNGAPLFGGRRLLFFSFSSGESEYEVYKDAGSGE